jgi:hypothetical protein
MQMNAPMCALVAQRDMLTEIMVPSPFRLLVFGGFKEVDGCVFFRALFPENSLGAMWIHRDRTGYECSVNGIHLTDYFEKGMSRESPALAATALQCAELLAKQLRKHRPDERFRIIASVDGRHCTMRFHKVREGESWLADDLEGYQDPIFVEDVGPEDV